MAALFAIVAGVSVGASVIAWIFNTLRKEEEKKHRELTEKIENIKKSIGDLQFDYKKKREALLINAFNTISDEYLKKIREYRKDKEQISFDLNNLYEQIKRIIARPETSPYLAQGLKRELLYVEDAKFRLDAYFRYLAWYEGKIELMRRYRNYEELLKYDPPNPLLPDEWLYVGKLLLLDGKHEIGTPNQYGQVLKLSGVFKGPNSSPDFTIEEEVLESYEKDIPLLIVHENRKVFNSTDESPPYNARALFRGSILKGELYINHLIPQVPFSVKPKGDVYGREYNFYLYKDAIECKMRRVDKKFPLKNYYPEDEIIVYPLEHDLLLKNLWVTERPVQREEKTLYPVYIVVTDESQFRKLISEIDQTNNEYLLTDYDRENKQIQLKNGQSIINCAINNQCLKVINFSIGEIKNSIAIKIPFSMVILSESEFIRNLELLEDSKFSIIKLIDFIEAELRYKEHSDQSKHEYEFYDRWLKLIEFQVKKEEFDYSYVHYKKMLIENDSKVITFEIDKSGDNISKLIEIDQKTKETLSKTPTPSESVKIALEIKASEKEPFKLSILGTLKDNIDLIYNTVTVELDDQIPDTYILNPEKRLYIGIYRPAFHLFRQKRALIRFQEGELANQELKRLLISPSLIRKTTNPYEEEAFEKSVKWKNQNLTENQKDIIKKALLENNIFLIQGPPGTGKTTVIKEIVHQFLKHSSKKRVLIVSQQNVAVDNALSRIYQDNYQEWFQNKNKSIVRVAADEGKVDELLRELTVDKWFKEYRDNLANRLKSFRDKKLSQFAQYWFNIIDRQDISKVDREVADVLISSHQIVGATCVGFANKRIGLDRTTFDLVIIDEAARATPPELLIPILRARKIILIGDQYQLPPSIGKALIDEAEEETFDFEIREFIEKSFFERLYNETPDTNKGFLTEQFRMPAEIGDLVSNLFYNGKLKNGIIKSKSDFIEPQVLRWIDVKGNSKTEGVSKFNQEEAIAVRNLLIEIQKRLGPSKKKTVAVITPYSAQKKLLKKLIHNLIEEKILTTLDIKCDTVDSFQGQEADIVIYSVVRTKGRLDFILDRRRLNVAISRTKENLYFVGHRDYLYNAETYETRNYFSEIIDYIRKIESK